MRRIVFGIYVFILAGSFFVFIPVHAADVAPEKNPVCWTKQDCQDQFKANFWTFSDKNWDQKGPGGVCGALGLCVPAGKETLLTIGIGPIKSVANMGDYIKQIYLYLVGIGGLIAVILIIKGGFQYATSAGSSERITSAKGSITSAILGLLLLLGSYAMLYTVNPDLVRLKLPQMYMLRPIALLTDWCKDLPAGSSVTEANKPYDKIQNADWFDPSKWTNLRFDQKGFNATIKLDCLKDYYVKGQGDKCRGHLCQLQIDKSSQACIFEGKDNTGKNITKCAPGNLTGTVAAGGVIFDQAKGFIDRIMLIGICKNGDLIKAADGKMETGNNKQSYVFNLGERGWRLAQECASSGGGVRGFYLGAEVNDTPGEDDYFAIGRDGKSCSLNLAYATTFFDTPHTMTDENWPAWSCSQIAYHEGNKLNSLDVPTENLISLEELESGTVCDIIINRDEFPALPNLSVIDSGWCFHGATSN